MSGSGFQNELAFGMNADFTGSDPPEDINGLGANAIDNEIWLGRSLVNSDGSHVYVTQLLAAGGITLNFNRIDPFDPANPSTLTITGPGVTQDLHVARFIVSAGGIADGANFTTLANAYAAAVLVGGHQTVFLQPGTYVEDIALVDGINIAAFVCDARTPNVTILGKLTFSTAGTITLSGIRLQTNADYCLQSTGAAAVTLNVNECNIVANNNTAINITNANASLNIAQCRNSINANGIALFAISAGNHVFSFCNTANAGVTSTASTLSGGTLIMKNMQFQAGLTTSNNAELHLVNVQMGNNTTPQNVTMLTCAGTSQHDAFGCVFFSGTSSAINVVDNLEMVNCTVTSSNAVAITGAGTLEYANLGFTNSSVIDVTTQVPLVSSNDAVRVKNPGAYPYTVVGQDSFVTVNTGSARTINLPPAPSTGEIHTIKDATGTSNTNNVTIQGNGNNIDGAATQTISTAYGTKTFVYNGTEWNQTSSGAGDLHVARYIVSAGGATDGANYTTIAAAITAAAAAGGKQTVHIQPGTYTENLTLSANVNLAAYQCDARSASVVIVGKLTANFAGTVGLTGLNLRTNGDYCIEATAGAGTLTVFGCQIDAVDNNAINLATGGKTFNFTSCTFDIEAGGIATFTMTTGAMNWNYCINSNAASSTTDNTQSGGTLTCKFCQLQPGIVTSGTASIYLDGCQLGRFNAPQNHTQLTCGGSGDHKAIQCYFLSGTAAAVSVGDNLTMANCTIRSTNTNPVTGAGAVQYSNLTFEASGNGVNTTTVTTTYADLGKSVARQQPSFLAYLNTSVNNVTGDATTYTIIFDTEVYDRGGNFTIGTSTFTAPITGLYQFDLGTLLGGGTSMSLTFTQIVTTARTYQRGAPLSAASVTSCQGVNAVLADMTAGDTATFTITATDTGGKIDDINGTSGGVLRTWVSGTLVA